VIFLTLCKITTTKQLLRRKMTHKEGNLVFIPKKQQRYYIRVVLKKQFQAWVSSHQIYCITFH